MKVLLVVSLLMAQMPPAIPTALLGIWELESMRGAVPLGLKNFRALCGEAALSPSESPDGAATGSPDARQMTSLGSLDATLTISVAENTVTIARKYSGFLGDASFSRTYQLDGVAASVSGAALRTSTVVGAEKATGKTPCTVREVFEVDGNGALRITATATEGTVTSSVQNYVRKSKTLHHLNEGIR